jgi:hypothetical protein
VTQALNLSRPVRCRRGRRFTRTHGNQKLCEKCLPNKRKAMIAARRGTS